MKNINIKRTDAEIADAIEQLKNNKKQCRRYNYFGGDNHAKLDVVIDTIQNKRSEDYVYTTYPSCNENDEEDLELHDLWQAGMSGLEYLRNDIDITDLLYPVSK